MTKIEGPTERYIPALRQMVCDQCECLRETSMYNRLKGEVILSASCRHPARRPLVLSIGIGYPLEVVSSGGQYVPTPDDCPVLVKEKESAKL